MKNLINIKIWTLLSVFTVMMAGCTSDFLNRPPRDSVVAESFYQTDDQVRASTALLYSKVWADFNEKATFALGDFRGGTAMAPYNGSFTNDTRFMTTAETPENMSQWQAFYNVVGQSNTAILNINKFAGEAVSQTAKDAAIGEAHFMRALAYRYLVMNWGPVPIITNNANWLMDPLSAHTNTVQSIWRFITEDMRQAAELLPATSSQPGRVTKWSAEGMLARFYLTRAGVESKDGVRNQQFLDSAKYYARDVIMNSGKALLPNYRDLFLYNYDNNNESLFELEWVYVPPPATWGFANATIDQLAASSTIIGTSGGWGGNFTATMWMLSQYAGFNFSASGDTLKGRTMDQRLKETFMLPGFVYPEITRTINGVDQNPFIYPNNNLGGTFDGNKGNPWDPSYANIKKYIIGQPKDVAKAGGQADYQDFPNNTYMMRLAELYLIYAEAELGNQASTSDPIALQYFNAVHTRAGLPAYDLTQDGPLTFDKIFQERACEFAMEAMLWYDLVQLHYWNPQKAYDIIQSQYRGQIAILADKFPNPTEWTILKITWSAINTVTVNDGNFQLPLPAAETVVAPNLKLPPVDYYAQ